MAHLILTGATGLVGSGALDAMLRMNAVSKISILSRRPVPMAEGKEKVNVIIHKDYGTYGEDVLAQLKGAQGCVWALGISQNAVSKEEYIKITKDYTLAAADAFSTLSPTFNFVFVSGEGATTSPGAFTPTFGRYKGETEAALLEMHKKNPALRVYSVRPAMVDPAGHEAIAPYLPSNFDATLRKYLGPAVRAVWKSGVTPTKQLGEQLTELALSDGKPLEGEFVDGEGRTIWNKRLRKIWGI